jgi:hypothetical protein
MNPPPIELPGELMAPPVKGPETHAIRMRRQELVAIENDVARFLKRNRLRPE